MPKTRSGKVSGGVIAKIANVKGWTMPATIDDPIILDAIVTALKSIGYAAAQKT